MGAWGIGPFDDDTAMELVEDGPDWTGLRSKLVAMDNADYLEFVDAVHGWTSAALVARALGASFGDVDDDIEEAVSALGVMPDGLPVLAIQALTRLGAGNSHLYELWEDSDSFEDWHKGLSALRTFLETHIEVRG